MLLTSTFLWCKVVLTFKSVDEIPKCDRSNENTSLSRGAFFHRVVQCRFNVLVVKIQW